MFYSNLIDCSNADLIYYFFGMKTCELFLSRPVFITHSRSCFSLDIKPGL